jgi:hypothetical protein
VFSLVFGSWLAQGQVPGFIFATSVAGTNENFARAIAVDSAGNCFLTGNFTGTASFGPTNLTSAGQTDIFVAKCDGTGKLLWVRQAGGTNYDEGHGIAVDSLGNCYVTGYFEGAASFGSTNLSSAGTNGEPDIFVAKYDGSGNLVWSRQAGGDSDDYGYGIAVDTNGSSCVTGLSGDGRFLMKYDTDGSLIWAKSVSGGGFAVAFDREGNIWLAGTAGLYPDLGMYLGKYDSGGNEVWGTAAGTNSGASAIAVDSSDNVFVTGGFSGAMTVDSATIWSSGFFDAWLAKYSSNGSLQWLKQMGGSDYDFGDGVVTDLSGNCFVTGEFSGSATFGPTNLVSFGGTDTFIAKYDSLGDLYWITHAGGGQLTRPGGQALRAGSGVYAAGGFNGDAMFGNTILTNGSFADYTRNTFLTRVDEMPILTASNNASAVILSWPTNQVGFTLQRAIGLSGPVSWLDVTNGVGVSGDRYVVVDPLSGSSSFYRLRKP